MSVIWLLLSSLCVLALAYRYYAAFIAARVLMLDDRNVTPSVTRNDGKDFVPTNKWIVFGHHFAAIAGAGPMIGPTLAAQYGWGPGFFWILLGSVFAGCVHDMILLFASIRHQGQSLSVIARRDVSRLTGVTTAFVTLFIIIVALAGLAVAVTNALFNNPWGVFTIGMTIPIACGAISGFHALIGSGTTPKMLEKESQIPLVGYGAMLTEAFVGLMALLAAVTLVPNDYFAINSSAEAFARLNMPVRDLTELCRLVGLDVSHRPGGATTRRGSDRERGARMVESCIATLRFYLNSRTNVPVPCLAHVVW